MNIYQRIVLILAAVALIVAFITAPLVVYMPKGIVKYDPNTHESKWYIVATDCRIASMRTIVILGVTVLLFFALKGIKK